jgi:hypothetical protein
MKGLAKNNSAAVQKRAFWATPESKLWKCAEKAGL